MCHLKPCRSLEALLNRLKAEGYDLGELDLPAAMARAASATAAAAGHVTDSLAEGAEDMLSLGEALVAGLARQDDQRAVSRGALGEWTAEFVDLGSHKAKYTWITCIAGEGPVKPDS